MSVRYDCLEPLGFTVTEAAKNLGVSRKQLSAVVNGHLEISPEMAIRLNKTFGGLWVRVPVAGCLRLDPSDKVSRSDQN